MNTSFEQVINSADEYYTQKIQQYGANARGVDWNSEESQFLRFEQLLKVCSLNQDFSIIDYGCGYGAFLDFLISKKYKFKSYVGYDISSLMIEIAGKKNIKNDKAKVFFCNTKSLMQPANFLCASGVFNVKQNIDPQLWESYVTATLKEFSTLSQQGFAFNLLSQYSDSDKMRSDLYYANPCFFFDFCKNNFSKNVSLLHDYDLYEFTILVKK